MINYTTDENNIIVQVDKSSKKALEGYKQTNENICPEMIDNLDGTFSNPVTVPNIEVYKQAQQAHVLEVLKSKDYDSLQNLALYTSRPTSIYHDEAVALADWNEACIIAGYQTLNDVKDNLREMPTVDEYIAELPKYGF